MALVALFMASVSLGLSRGVLGRHGISGCGMVSVGVAWPHCVWLGLSGCVMSSVGVSWPNWV